MITIGDRIKAAREAKDLSPTDLATLIKRAKAVSITPQAIYQMESGDTKNPKPKTLLAIADALEEDVVYLISGVRRKLRAIGNESAKADLVEETDKFSSDEIIELLALYQQANTRERENILDLARSIGKRSGLRWVKLGHNQA